MTRIFVSLRKHARLLAIATLALGVTAANAQAPAGPHRPAGVPDGYLITPSGYFHHPVSANSAREQLRSK